MKIEFLFSAILLFTITSLSAQEGDKKSQQILKETTDLTRSYQTMKIDFTYKMENKEANISESYEGVLLSKGDKYNLTFSGQTIISDGKTVWTYLQEAKEVQVNSAVESDNAANPTKILTSYNKDFKSKFIKEEVEAGRKLWVIDMVPVKGKSFYKIRLSIDQLKKQITSILIYEKNGSTFQYKVRKFQSNVPVDEKKFTFNAKDYPGVEVIDMR